MHGRVDAVPHAVPASRRPCFRGTAVRPRSGSRGQRAAVIGRSPSIAARPVSARFGGSRSNTRAPRLGEGRDRGFEGRHAGLGEAVWGSGSIPCRETTCTRVPARPHCWAMSTAVSPAPTTTTSSPNPRRISGVVRQGSATNRGLLRNAGGAQPIVGSPCPSARTTPSAEWLLPSASEIRSRRPIGVTSVTRACTVSTPTSPCLARRRRHVSQVLAVVNPRREAARWKVRGHVPPQPAQEVVRIVGPRAHPLRGNVEPVPRCVVE